jgi:hypothetical protein
LQEDPAYLRAALVDKYGSPELPEAGLIACAGGAGAVLARVCTLCGISLCLDGQDDTLTSVDVKLKMRVKTLRYFPFLSSFFNTSSSSFSFLLLFSRPCHFFTVYRLSLWLGSSTTSFSSFHDRVTSSPFID